MDNTRSAEQETYRLVVTRKNASEVLLLSHGGVPSLPVVRILRGHRIALQLTESFQSEPKLRTYCLFTGRTASSNQRSQSGNYAILETLDQNQQAFPGAAWMPVTQAREKAVCSSADQDVMRRSFEELARFARDSSAAPFAKPGWLHELIRWVQKQVDPLGLRLTGNVLQLTGAPTFSLLRLETNGPALWFKAAGRPILHELPVSVAVSRLFPEFTPPLLGVHATWNGWLTREVSRNTLDDFTEAAVWQKAAETLARLQILSVGREGELLACQCRDLRLPGLVEKIDPFLARMAEAMERQEKQAPRALTPRELDRLGHVLRRQCSVLHEVGLPDTLGHMDLNPGNVVVSPERCVFVDWAEGCVTNPLLIFHYLRQHLQRKHSRDPRAAESLASGYLRPWQKFVPTAALRAALTTSSLPAVFAYAIATIGWQSSEILPNSSLDRYLRSLTRRMHREAVQLERGEPCLA